MANHGRPTLLVLTVYKAPLENNNAYLFLPRTPPAEIHMAERFDLYTLYATQADMGGMYRVAGRLINVLELTARKPMEALHDGPVAMDSL